MRHSNSRKQLVFDGLQVYATLQTEANKFSDDKIVTLKHREAVSFDGSCDYIINLNHASTEA